MIALPYYKEEWKDIPEYEGLYQVSNFIKVLNVKTGKLLAFSVTNKNYYQVNLWKNGKCKHYSVHRLIAQAFVPNPDNKPEVDHINTFKDDNWFKNLKWVTKKEQQNNPLTRRHISEGLKEKHINRYDLSKPIQQYSLDGILINEYPSLQEASRQTGLYPTNICKALKGRYKSAGGYVWRYV